MMASGAATNDTMAAEVTARITSAEHQKAGKGQEDAEDEERRKIICPMCQIKHCVIIKDCQQTQQQAVRAAAASLSSDSSNKSSSISNNNIIIIATPDKNDNDSHTTTKRKKAITIIGGLVVYLAASCPICLEEHSPLVALPCGHAFCQVDFETIVSRGRRIIPGKRSSRRPPRNAHDHDGEEVGVDNSSSDSDDLDDASSSSSSSSSETTTDVDEGSERNQDWGSSHSNCSSSENSSNNCDNGDGIQSTNLILDVVNSTFNDLSIDGPTTQTGTATEERASTLGNCSGSGRGGRGRGEMIRQAHDRVNQSDGTVLSNNTLYPTTRIDHQQHEQLRNKAAARKSILTATDANGNIVAVKHDAHRYVHDNVSLSAANHFGNTMTAEQQQHGEAATDVQGNMNDNDVISSNNSFPAVNRQQDHSSLCCCYLLYNNALHNLSVSNRTSCSSSSNIPGTLYALWRNLPTGTRLIGGDGKGGIFYLSPDNDEEDYLNEKEDDQEDNIFTDRTWTVYHVRWKCNKFTHTMREMAIDAEDRISGSNNNALSNHSGAFIASFGNGGGGVRGRFYPPSNWGYDFPHNAKLCTSITKSYSGSSSSESIKNNNGASHSSSTAAVWGIHTDNGDLWRCTKSREQKLYDYPAQSRICGTDGLNGLWIHCPSYKPDVESDSSDDDAATLWDVWHVNRRREREMFSIGKDIKLCPDVFMTLPPNERDGVKANVVNEGDNHVDCLVDSNICTAGTPQPPIFFPGIWTTWGEQGISHFYFDSTMSLHVSPDGQTGETIVGVIRFPPVSELVGSDGKGGVWIHCPSPLIEQQEYQQGHRCAAASEPKEAMADDDHDRHKTSELELPQTVRRRGAGRGGRRGGRSHAHHSRSGRHDHKAKGWGLWHVNLQRANYMYDCKHNSKIVSDGRGALLVLREPNNSNNACHEASDVATATAHSSQRHHTSARGNSDGRKINGRRGKRNRGRSSSALTNSANSTGDASSSNVGISYRNDRWELWHATETSFVKICDEFIPRSAKIVSGF